MSSVDKQARSIQKLHDFYNMKPNAPVFLREFGYYTLDRWISEGHIKSNKGIDENEYLAYLGEVFDFDTLSYFSLFNLGWCEAPFMPEFPTLILEDRGEHEVVQDFAGRHVLFFKGRRSGFMPEYIDNPVKDMLTWERDVKWRLSVTPERLKDADNWAMKAKEAADINKIVSQYLIGGYMYLRSLIGPEKLLFMFYDEPELIHDCMKTWFEVSDAVIARHQKVVTLDEVFIAEDICYNHGSLISPDMMDEFLFPYYQQLLDNCRKRQLDKARKMHFQVDTDGYCLPVIEQYMKLGMNYMSPMEVASGCDVVEVGKKYPNLLMHGGFDKRIIAEGKEAIDREVDRILPVMRARGGYFPTCDHGVPEEVSFENYVHFRKRLAEYGK